MAWTPYEIFNVTMTGSALAVTLPDNVRGVAFQATGGSIDMSIASGGDVWSIADGGKEALQNVNLSGQTFYFNGASGVKLQYRVEYGLAS